MRFNVAGDGVGADPHIPAANTTHHCIQCSGTGNGTTPDPPYNIVECPIEGDLNSRSVLVSPSSKGPWVAATHVPARPNSVAFLPNGTVFLAEGACYPGPAGCTGKGGRLPGPGRNAFMKVHRAETLDDGLAGKWEQMPMTYELAGVVREAKMQVHGSFESF